MRSLSTDAFGNALGSSLADQASSSSTWTIGATEVASPVTTRVMGYSATVGPDDEIGPTTSVQLGQGDAIATPVQPYPPDNSVPLPHMADLPRPRMTISDEEALSIAVTLGGGMGVDPSIENPYVASGLYGLEGNIAAPIGQAMIDYKVGPRTLGLAGTVLSGYGVAAGLATGNVPLVALSLDQMYANANLAVNGESSPTFLNQGLQAGLGLQPSEAAVAEMYITAGVAAGPSAINAGRTFVNGMGNAASETIGSIMTPYTAAGRSMTSDSGGLGLTYRPTSGVVLQSQEGVTTTILGSYNNDMRYVIGELGNVKSTEFGPRVGGFNVLNVPDNLYSPKTFWGDYNRPWLNNAIDRRDNFLLATTPGFDVPDAKSGISVLMRPNAITGKMELSGFGREYLMMRQNGYVYQNGVMVRKW